MCRWLDSSDVWLIAWGGPSDAALPDARCSVRSKWRFLLPVLLILNGLIAPAAPAAARPAAEAGRSADGAECPGAPWLDPARTPQQRARLVLAELTLDEKIQLL